jgi:hypothetical protein
MLNVGAARGAQLWRAGIGPTFRRGNRPRRPDAATPRGRRWAGAWPSAGEEAQLTSVDLTPVSNTSVVPAAESLLPRRILGRESGHCGG